MMFVTKKLLKYYNIVTYYYFFKLLFFITNLVLPVATFLSSTSKLFFVGNIIQIPNLTV